MLLRTWETKQDFGFAFRICGHVCLLLCLIDILKDQQKCVQCNNILKIKIIIFFFFWVEIFWSFLRNKHQKNSIFLKNNNYLTRVRKKLAKERRWGARASVCQMLRNDKKGILISSQPLIHKYPTQALSLHFPLPSWISHSLLVFWKTRTLR